MTVHPVIKNTSQTLHYFTIDGLPGIDDEKRLKDCDDVCNESRLCGKASGLGKWWINGKFNVNEIINF